jgi:iron(III) transport system permease protein
MRRRRTWGRGRGSGFFSITLPLIRPGVFAGATIVFIWSFTELGTPLMFDYYTVTPVQDLHAAQGGRELGPSRTR